MTELKREIETTPTDNVEIVVFSGDNGEESFYAVNMVIDMEGKKFALLTEVEMVDDCVEPVDSPDMFVARIETDESGEEAFVDPTEEEFAAVLDVVKEFQEPAEE